MARIIQSPEEVRAFCALERILASDPHSPGRVVRQYIGNGARSNGLRAASKTMLMLMLYEILSGFCTTNEIMYPAHDLN